MLFYVYCVVLRQSEESFYNSTIGKVFKLIEIHSKIMNANKESQVIECNDLNDFL